MFLFVSDSNWTYNRNIHINNNFFIDCMETLSVKFEMGDTLDP